MHQLLDAAMMRCVALCSGVKPVAVRELHKVRQGGCMWRWFGVVLVGVVLGLGMTSCGVEENSAVCEAGTTRFCSCAPEGEAEDGTGVELCEDDGQSWGACACGDTPAPVSEPEGEPAGEPEAEPEQEPEGEPAGEPEGEPAGEPEGEPAGEPDAEPDAEPGMMMGGGRTACETQEDCDIACAARPGLSDLGCACNESPAGLFCAPRCETTDDCPPPPANTVFICNEEQGICVRDR